MLGVLISCAKVPAGYVGIKVYLLGSNKGVDSETLGVGRYWIGLNEELYLFPVFQQNYSWQEGEAFNFSTMDGMSVSADIGITFSFDRSKIDQIFQKYRLGVDEIVAKPLKNSVRDALARVASRYPIEGVYGQDKGVIMNQVLEMVQAKFVNEGILVENLYLLGQPRFPENVVASINAKVEAVQKAQRAENELREAEAQAQKAVATAQGEAESMLVKARAEAQANQLKQSSLTSNLIEYEKIQKWDGLSAR
ncbi:UNVERIFIED_CONTAM: hypothetical protein PYX00_010974 [Menopon gallinae]|uniref:Band 7 domain-containing protein n=1 Tax=Menopon gallinae TaxID=328185 RepID=A0AAW2H6W3_9NEOP